MDATLIINYFQLSQSADRYCVFWDVNSKTWTNGNEEENCKTIPDGLQKTICQCNHLTNFGVLFDINGALGDWVQWQMDLLNYMSMVLMSLSILAATATFVILTISRYIHYYFHFLKLVN